MGSEENQADGQTYVGKEAGAALVMLPVLGSILRLPKGQGTIDLVSSPGFVITPGNQLLPQQDVEPGHIDDPHEDDEDHQPQKHGAEIGGDEETVNSQGMTQVQADDDKLAQEGDQDGEGGQRAQGWPDSLIRKT